MNTTLYKVLTTDARVLAEFTDRLEAEEFARDRCRVFAAVVPSTCAPCKRIATSHAPLPMFLSTHSCPLRRAS